MSKLNITYTPNLSIPENAEKAGVSSRAVQKYMERHNISGRENNFRNRIATLRKAIEQLEKGGIAVNGKRLSEITGYSPTTIRKYLSILYDKESKIRTNLVHKNAHSFFVIKSVSHTQKEIIENIIRLYIPSKKIDCDLTYSTGKMWKGLPCPPLKFDKYPQIENVRPLAEVERMTDRVASVMVDPPFVISIGQTIDEAGKSLRLGSNLISNRFSCFNSEEQMQQANAYLLSQAWRILHKNGILIYKIQDTVSSGRQIFTHLWVANHAQRIGFELIDIFILHSRQRVLSPKHQNQQHARKYHAYFLVFRKK